MVRAHKPKLVSASETYDAVADYARDRLGGFGGSWLQDPYKRDFFNIFYDAYYSRVCGFYAMRKYGAAYNRRKKNKPAMKEFVVDGEKLRVHLRSLQWWKKADRRDRESLAEDLAIWWDAWTFAWDKHPSPIAGPYHRRRTTSTDAPTE